MSSGRAQTRPARQSASQHGERFQPLAPTNQETNNLQFYYAYQLLLVVHLQCENLLTAAREKPMDFLYPSRQ